MQQTISKREVHRNTILPQETKKNFSKQPSLVPKTTKEEQSPKLAEGKKS